MIKVMWLIKRADHLTMEEFEKWWTEKQAPDIRDEQVPHLVRYIVNIRTEDNLRAEARRGSRSGTASPRSGSRPRRPSTRSTRVENRPRHTTFRAHTSRCQRLIVKEIDFV